MLNPSKAKIATVATVAGLTGLAGVAIASNPGAPTPATQHAGATAGSTAITTSASGSSASGSQTALVAAQPTAVPGASNPAPVVTGASGTGAKAPAGDDEHEGEPGTVIESD